MKKFISGFVLSALSLICLVAFVPTSFADSSLVVKKCSGCHSLKRVCRDLGKKDLAGWTETVTRMVSLGANLDAKVVQELSATLADTKPDGNSFCN